MVAATLREKKFSWPDLERIAGVKKVTIEGVSNQMLGKSKRYPKEEDVKKYHNLHKKLDDWMNEYFRDTTR